jgi:hypothetical protein
MSFLDETIRKIKAGEQVSTDELVYLADQFEKMELDSKSCCCEDGTMDKSFDMSDPKIAGFSKEKDREYPFPTIGSAPCDKCHGANVMRSLNERQKERIRILQLQLEQAIEEREKVAKLLYERREIK